MAHHWHAVTHSTVELPTAAFERRLARLARECRSRALAPLPPGAPPAAVVAAVTAFLQGEQRFRVPATGRSALPAASVLDHRAAFFATVSCVVRLSGTDSCLFLIKPLRCHTLCYRGTGEI